MGQFFPPKSTLTYFQVFASVFVNCQEYGFSTEELALAIPHIE